MKNLFRTLIFTLALAQTLASFAQGVLVIKPNPNVGKDASVFSNNPTANYGIRNGLNLYTWTNSGNLGLKRAFLIFPLGNVVNANNVDSAKLKLYYNPTDDLEGFSTHWGNTDFFVERVIAPWSELTVNWNNQPATTNQNQVAVAGHTSTTQNFTDIDVTNLVIDMLGPNEQNFGFCLKMQNETNPYRGLLFASSDHDISALRPELRIYYSLATNIMEQDGEIEFSLYPNPSTGLFSVNTNQAKDIRNMQVLDQTGRILLSSGFQAQIDLSKKAAGIYFLQIQDFSGRLFTKKLILR